MNDSIKFTVPGEPVAKGRPKFTNAGKFPRAYTPAKTRNYEDWVALNALQHAPDVPFNRSVALFLRILVYRPIPKSLSKKKRALAIDGKLLPTSRPDLDNYEKAITDGIGKTGRYFEDDSQICVVMCKKLYGEVPRVEIEIGKI